MTVWTFTDQTLAEAMDHYVAALRAGGAADEDIARARAAILDFLTSDPVHAHKMVMEVPSV